MEFSLALSKIIGLYMIVMGIFLLKNKSELPALISQFKTNKGLIYSFASYSLIIGLILSVSHSRFNDAWRILITLIGYYIVLKSLFVLFAPRERLNTFVDYWNSQKRYLAVGVANVVIGVYLALIGFLF